MKKIFLSCLAVAISLLPSCIEYETEVTINKDGSGTITDEMVMGPQMVGMMEMAAAQGGKQQNPLVEMKDETKLKAKAAEYGEGVSFLSATDVKRNDGSKGVRVTYKFTDINKVTFSPNSGMSKLGGMKPGGKVEEVAAEAKATFTYNDGKLTINLPQPEGEESSEGKGGQEFDPNDPQMAMMSEMMRGMKMSAKVTLAEGIAKTNATHHADGSITLFELNFDEVMKNPEGLKSLSGLDSKNPATIGKALEKVKGAKAETQKVVTATSK